MDLDTAAEPVAPDGSPVASTDTAKRRTARVPGPLADGPFGWLGVVVVLALVTIVVPIGFAHHYGAFGVPRGDDWSYVRTLFHWNDTGHLNFNHWVSMTLLGQLVAALPIVKIAGKEIGPLQMLTSAFGFVGLLAVVATGKSMTRRLAPGLFIAIVVAGGPMWAILATTFMTDVPGTAMSMATIAVGAWALTRRPVSTRGIVVAFVLATFAFTIRQYAVIPGVALGIVALLMRETGRDRSVRRTTVIAGGLTVVAMVVFLIVWRTVPDAKSLAPKFPTTHSVTALVYKGGGLLRLLGLWLSPAIVLAGPRRIIRRAWWKTGADTTIIVGTFATIGLAATGYKGRNIAFAGNYFVPDGALSRGVSSGRRPLIVPYPLWNVLIAVGTIGAVLLVLAALPPVLDAVTRVRRRDLTVADPVATLLALTTAGYVAGYGLAAFTTLPLYDRYVMPIVPVAGLLLIRRDPDADVDAAARRAETPVRSMPRRAVASLALAVLVGLGWFYAADSAAFDGVRWRVAADAVRLGATRCTNVDPTRCEHVAPRDIGGNFEWVNYFAARPGSYDPKRKFCIRVVVARKPRLKLQYVVARGTYRPPFHDPLPVLAIRTLGKSCAGVPRVDVPRP